ncbi:unnamed protein product [Caretta caretta]
MVDPAWTMETAMTKRRQAAEHVNAALLCPGNWGHRAIQMTPISSITISTSLRIHYQNADSSLLEGLENGRLRRSRLCRVTVSGKVARRDGGRPSIPPWSLIVTVCVLEIK